MEREGEEGVETQGEGDVLRREGMEALQWDFRSSGVEKGERGWNCGILEMGGGGAEEGAITQRWKSRRDHIDGRGEGIGIHQLKDKAPGKQADGVALPHCNILK